MAPASPTRAGGDASPPPDAVADAAVALLGRLVASLPGGRAGGEARPGQQAMTRLVADALARGTSVAVRAGTGTGKSLAVLAAVAASGRRTVLATATKALQDQYVGKELPLVADVLARTAPDEPLVWAVLKGRANYLCLARLAESTAAAAAQPTGPADQSSLFEPTPDADTPERRPASAAAGQLDAVHDWAATTLTGDLAELPFELDRTAAAWVATGPDGCPGASRCSFASACFSEAAIAAAREAQLVVLNTALLGADLAMGSTLVGEADAYVLDEAHEAEDILAGAFGASLHPDDLDRLDRQARALAPAGPLDELRRSLRRHRDTLAAALEAHRGERLPDGLPADHPVGVAVTTLGGMVAQLQQRARDAADDDRTDVAAEACRRVADRVFESVTRLLDDPAGDAVWVDADTATLRRVPIEVGPRLREQAWKGRSVVLTSATLPATSPGRLGLSGDGAGGHGAGGHGAGGHGAGGHGAGGHGAGGHGAGGHGAGGHDAVTDVGSPFDHRGASRLYVPELLTHVPPARRSPTHPDWPTEAWAEAAAVIDAAEGRTLFLCTSVRNTEHFAERARAELQWPVLVQGERPKAALLAEFADDEHSVLFGTMGLWQGVDVPGPALSCVIIDKLPFPRPDDPLWQARTEHAAALYVEAGGEQADAGYHAFLQVSLPRAAALLAQASGRLLRTSTDRGLVVVLDPRLAEKSYRRAILAELPPMRRTRSRREAVDHLLAPTTLTVAPVGPIGDP